MSYEVEIAPAAKRQIKKLPRDVQQKLVAKLEELVFEPRPDGVKKLEGSENLYRVRLEKYRIIYEIQDSLLLVTVVKVKHRRDIYRL
ncbi:RelE/StbE family addiction module toxin [Nostoc linckia z18]|uniref:RelE/StbE family addiction module toxin n=2 Tax=Nostoc linckia TaxID=92942 RepID=A0A9Q6EIT9_NOSLI|nr:type II toxin-antitoxin system RelE/ParE family toxin [Nostoc linckia]PHK39309.1 RelE/StbE family addiction module toxin [Nostoc linckia z15]PHK45064.1 RelE/StbE family addiction module toxin [Nostoc linckia z16]PHJ68651.1 RelE/StbE family addiction module toxin [Nostoc linckia z1]PHJ70672.1 RelE/StbE family addiction module toxin [Nostoc linckia z3]PHJ76106.1 RelE/StbE family addiction module toxin [Nostoc linckia z2]